MKALLRIRLSHFYVIFFISYFILLSITDKVTLSGGQLTLFSVNSFLYGFYFGPLFTGQKARVEEMIKSMRQEELTILDILNYSHELDEADRHELKVKLDSYLKSIVSKDNVDADNPRYDDLLEYTSQRKFKNNDAMRTIYEKLGLTQQNRDQLGYLMKQGVWNHEWMVLLVLFAITIFFVVQIDYGDSWVFKAMAATLCSGLSMLVIILAKYSTLTHKQAKRIWDPIINLRKNHFEDV